MKAKEFLKASLGAIKKIPDIFGRSPIVFTLISAFVMELLIETFCRHSLIKAVVFLFTHPLMFLSCVAIILVTYSFAWIMKKGFIMWLTVTIVWLGLGIANGIVLLYRAAPLTGSDVAILGDVLPIIGVYLNVFQLILISVAILGAIGGLVFLWIKFPGKEIERKPRLIKFGGFTVSFAIITLVLSVTNVLPRNFSDLNKAYMDYGFPYGLTSSIFVQGISEPDDYSPDEIEKIMERIEAKKQQSGKVEGTEHPNVIYVQLELRTFYVPSVVREMDKPNGETSVRIKRYGSTRSVGHERQKV